MDACWEVRVRECWLEILGFAGGGKGLRTLVDSTSRKKRIRDGILHSRIYMSLGEFMMSCSLSA